MSCERDSVLHLIVRRKFLLLAVGVPVAARPPAGLVAGL